MQDSEAQDNHSYLSHKLSKRLNREWWTITLFLCALSILIAIYPGILGIKKLENNLYDFYTDLHTQGVASQDITIITIDDKSLSELGSWPWRRSLHAELLSKLHLANSVILDFKFTEHSPFGSSDDLVLAKAIKEHGKTYIPLICNPIFGPVKPVDVLSDAAKGLGHINIPVESDGVVRSFNSYVVSIDKQITPHISAIALGLENDIFDQPPKRLINWAGSANTYNTIPYHMVLSSKVTPEDFKDKYVFVGAWSNGLGDVYNTPTTSNGMQMSGVEILANIADNLSNDTKISRLNNYLLSLFNLVFVIFTCIAVRYFAPRRSFSLILVSLFILFCTTTFVFYSFAIWIPPIASLVAIIVIFPIWSWRTQYVALLHIESELTHFISQSSNLSFNSNTNNARHGNQAISKRSKIKDLIFGRHALIDLIENLHATLENTKLSNTQRARLLNFLSHDMRSPLNAIMALCELYKTNSFITPINNSGCPDRRANKLKSSDLDKFEYYAQRTLNLVDNFIDLNRAQISSMTLRSFDFGELLINCCDESWIKAQTKNIKINYESIDYGYIINADYSLLQRVFINLINNAIQYSFEDTQITVNLKYVKSNYVVEVIDQGCGISDNHLEAIFSPYSRVNNSSDMHKPGVGLGLAFVQTVIKRHNGTIEVESVISKGSKFIISLPVSQ